MRSRTLLVVAFAPALAACAPDPAGETDTDTDTDTDTGAESDTEAPEPIDYCPSSGQPPAFALLEEGVRRHQAGHCGHIFYETDAQRLLRGPDLSARELLPGAPAVGPAAAFSATGHLLAYSLDGGVTLRDLRDGSERHQSAVTLYGFVPSADPELGARLWACRGGALGLIELDGAFRELDPAATCDSALSIKAALAAPLLVYGADEGQLRAVDVDTGQRVTLDIDYRRDHGANARADEFTVSAAGDLVLHEHIWIEQPDDIDTDWPHHEGSTLLAARSGAALKSTAPGVYLTLIESAAAGLPAVLRASGGESWRIAPDLTLHPLTPGLAPRLLLRDRARLLVHDGLGLALLDLATATLSPWLPGASELASTYALSPAQTRLAARVDTDACINKPGTEECTLIVSELHLADGGGVAPLARFSQGLAAVAVSDHGLVLAGLGLLPEPPPAQSIAHGVYLFAPDGAILQSWPGEPGAPKLRAFAQTGERLLAAIQSAQGISLEHIDGATGALTTLIPAVSFDLQLDLHPTAPRAVFRDAAAQTLYAGALP